MNTKTNFVRITIALLLCTGALINSMPVMGQGFTIVVAAADAGTGPQAKQEQERPEPPGCCLQANTGQPGWMVKIPGPSKIAAAVPVKPNPAWVPGFPGSSWIGPTSASGTSATLGGLYVYEYKFCLCREEQGQHPVLSLSWFSDNQTTAVTLNGGPNLLSAPTPVSSFQHPPGPFSVVHTGPVLPNGAGVCHPCPEVNTLTITVDNQPMTPTGLNAILNITGAIASVNGECRCNLDPLTRLGV